jgi:hypothetical protein
MVGGINISFVEYSTCKSAHLTPDIVEYEAEANAPLYDLIIKACMIKAQFWILKIKHNNR